jgi:hypothetical protein
MAVAGSVYFDRGGSMNEMNIERMENGVSSARKAYQSPKKLMVLGELDTVVLAGSSKGTDGGGIKTAS